MSLYNQIFGVSQFFPHIMLSLDLAPSDVPRIRDAYIRSNEGNLEFAVFARVGGNNRSEYQERIAALRQHQQYLRDEDDGFDSTYATFYFSVEEAYQAIAKQALQLQGDYDPMGQFRQMLDDLEQHRDTPIARRAIKIGTTTLDNVIKTAEETGNNSVMLLDQDHPDVTNKGTRH